MITLVTNITHVVELTAYPYTGSVVRRGKDVPVLIIPCTPDMTLNNVKETFSDETSTVHMILMDEGTTIREYTEYTKMEEISWVPHDVDENGENIPGYYIVKLSQKVTFEQDLLTMKKAMSEIRKDVTHAAEEKKEQDKEIGELKTGAEKIENAVQDIKKAIHGANPDELTLPELKEYLISNSKTALAEYLASNPISSSVHGGVTKRYSITSEKQTHLMAMIMMTANMEEARISGMKQFYETQYTGKESITFEEFMVGVENATITTGGVTFNKYQPSWNAVGEPCTYDWTLNELKQLAAEIEAVVRPLISRQQTMEVQIKEARSIEEAKAVNLSFVAAPKMRVN